MRFFDQLPPANQPEPEPAALPAPAWMKPETMLPGVTAVQFVLARADNAAVAVTGLGAYPNGVEFTLSVVLRQEDRRGRVFDAFHLVHGWQAAEPVPDEFLRLGLRFGDGAVAVNLPGYGWPGGDDEPQRPLLMQNGGGGGGRRYDQTYWVWPLPPPGPLTFVCEWPALGIAETSVDLDAGLLHAAAARAVALWPEDAQPA